MTSLTSTFRPRVVIIGGGFGGLSAAKQLAREPVDITLLDRTNFHLFQPLLYQVSMAGLSPAEIAWPLRSILRNQKNARVLMLEAKSIDLAAREVHVCDTEAGDDDSCIPYDYLVLAAGARTTYFGHDDWGKIAVGLKDLNDAVEIRTRVLLAFEAAERTTDPDERRSLMTFVIIGGGPTGVEIAGALAELSKFVLARDFRAINAKVARVILIEASSRILDSFSPDLSESALRQLQELNVEVRLNVKVTDVRHDGVTLSNGETIASQTIIWGAGVGATPLTETLGVPLDRGKRVIVEKDCSLPGHAEAFAIGDTAAFLHQGERALPGVSPVAMQQGRHVGRMIANDLAKKERETFHYTDKGSMATIGRSRAIAQTGRFKMSGYPAWMAWLAVHIFFLIGFKNRVFVLLNWAYSYFVYQRGARIITGRRLRPGAPEKES